VPSATATHPRRAGRSHSHRKSLSNFESRVQFYRVHNPPTVGSSSTLRDAFRRAVLSRANVIKTWWPGLRARAPRGAFR
jgi:hypothetical protein